MTGLVERLEIEPEAREWAALICDHGRTLTAEQRRFREQLGLPAKGPVVLMGHGAAFWHCGVLAKAFAVDAAARALGAAGAWLIVDQDEHAFESVRVPVRDGEGRLRAEQVILGPEAAKGVAAASCPAFVPREPVLRTGKAALPSVAEGLKRIVESLRKHRSAPDAARQVTAAVSELLSSFVPTPTVVFATGFARTDLFGAMVERMQRDALPMAEAYNAAVVLVPEAGVAPLQIDRGRGRVELPLWRLAPGSPRRRVFSGEKIEGIEGLAPRALLTTGLLRLAGCDLMIHGIGGSIYDRITEAWFKLWLRVELAPMALVTADVYLPLSCEEAGEKEVERAVWQAHRARHDPGLLGDAAAAAAKRKLVDQISRAREAGEHPAQEFRAMHALLEDVWTRHGARLKELSERAARLRRLRADSAIALDRTWAFALMPGDRLEAMRTGIVSEFTRRLESRS